MKTPSAFFAGLMSGAVALMALPALAEENAVKAGLPQLDPKLFPEQLFWLAISFTTLYLLMKYVALPGVESAQDKRKDVIEDDLATARKANEQANAMAHEADKALADARSNAQTTISEIKAQAAKIANDQQATQSKDIHQRLRDAETGIATARDGALKDIESAASDLAFSIVETVSGMKVKA